MARLVGVVALALLAWPADGAAKKRKSWCPPGKDANQETAWRCCWPGQVWNGKRCVGVPSKCPDGFDLLEESESCELRPCPDGQKRMRDRVHCCWPGQGWSKSRNACLGKPRCPPEYVAEEGGCTPGPTLTDTDEDGLKDAEDACVDQPEDIDGFEDEDGCPDEDNDADGVPDATDKCPDAPEDKDGFEDEDGCADPDNDGDGVPDASDKCPLEAEDEDGFEDEDGCLDPDDDGDGVPDTDDLCQGELEDRDGHADDDGCIDPDDDLDRILDDDDACRDSAEDYDLFEDEDGCPDPDNDADGVPDPNDQCPHEAEDGGGLHPADGCVRGADEYLAAAWFGPGDLGNFALHYTAHLPPEDVELDTTTEVGLGYHMRSDALYHALQAGLLILEGDNYGAAVTFSLGVHVLSWPRFDWNAFSLLNPAVGGFIQGALYSGGAEDEPVPDARAGVVASNVVVLGCALALGFDYRHGLWSPEEVFGDSFTSWLIITPSSTRCP
ncbi:MAG: hypothetical protein ACYTF3_07610 [Planctomycetota bacterium]|jgi:hypothetical protein